MDPCEAPPSWRTDGNHRRFHVDDLDDWLQAQGRLSIKRQDVATAMTLLQSGVEAMTEPPVALLAARDLLAQFMKGR